MPDKEVTTKLWFAEILKQVLAFASVLSALAYWLGYIYAEGFYNALNIDVTMLQLQWSDYLAFGWIFLGGGGLLLGMIVSIGVSVLIYYYFLAPLFDDLLKKYKVLLGRLLALGYIIYMVFETRYHLLAFWQNLSTPWRIVLIVAFVLVIFLSYLFRNPIQRMMIRWVEKLRSPEYGNRLDTLFLFSRNLVVLIVALGLFLAFMVFLGSQAERVGEEIGFQYLSNKTTQAEIVSSLPLMPGSVESDGVFTKKDLVFLFYNAGHYYLSSELDPADNCKPQDVIVVNEKDLIGFRKISSPNRICVPLNGRP
jgi:hypothetical protein